MGSEYIPALAWGQFAENVSRVRLARKLNIHGGLAWACAGEGQEIAQLRYEVIRQLDDWVANDERPARKLGDIANNLKVVKLVGAYCSGGVVNFVTPNDDRRTLRHLGICEATGSGASDLMAKCVSGDELLNDPIWSNSAEFARIAGLIASINGRRLAEEITGQNRNGWGGYIEWAYHDMISWKRGPRTLNLFYFIDDVFSEKWTFSQIAPLILYEPGLDVGRVLSISPQHNVEFHLKPVQQHIEDQIDSGFFDWRTWIPEWVNTTVICRLGEIKHRYISKSIESHLINSYLNFRFEGDFLFCNLKNEYLQKLMADSRENALKYGSVR